MMMGWRTHSCGIAWMAGCQKLPPYVTGGWCMAAAGCGMSDFWCMADADTICADDICCIDCSAFSRCDWSMYDAGLPLDGTCGKTHSSVPRNLSRKYIRI